MFSFSFSIAIFEFSQAGIEDMTTCHGAFASTSTKNSQPLFQLAADLRLTSLLLDTMYHSLGTLFI